MLALGGLLAVLCGGCPVNLEDVLDELEELELNINRTVNVVQQEDPREVVLPAGLEDRGDTIIIDNSVTVVNDVQEDLVVEELPTTNLLGFENLTGADIYLTYAVDGEVQGVLVFDGETLLLEYDCFDLLEMISEEDFDPVTGVFLDEFDLTGIDFVSGLDFFCGEALIVTVDPVNVTGSVETIDLLPQ